MKHDERDAREIFAASIKFGMAERNMGINKLSKLSGVNKPQIYNLLNVGHFQIDTYIRLARCLKIHIEFSLMSESNNVFTILEKGSKN